MKKMSEADYNERLFSGGLRGFIHGSRFVWLRESLRRARASSESVLELGSYDGRSISYLPKPPSKYVGLDANWERGVELGRARWGDNPNIRFEICTTPSEMHDWVGDRRFDTALCLETLEHVQPDLVDPYIREIARATTGHLIVTVPNEKGPLFLGKYVAKRLFGDYYPYRPSEVWWATVGRLDRVERSDHKGFDYDTIIRTVGSYFDVVETSGYPFRHLPKWANFGVGIIARARRRPA